MGSKIKLSHWIFSALVGCELILAANIFAGPVVNLSHQQSTKIGLALSGGGALGIAHIGVIKALEDENIPINMIAGTSMGSIVGGLYACGYSAEQLIDFVNEVEWNRIFSGEPKFLAVPLSQRSKEVRPLLTLRLKQWNLSFPLGLLNVQRINETFFRWTAAANYAAQENFDLLPIPYRAVAVDIANGEKVVLSNGSLAKALRASMAIPLMFTPCNINGRLLVDGGVLDVLPVDEVKQMGADRIIAVDVGKLLPQKAPNNIIDLANRTIDIMIDALKDQAENKPDVLIRPDLGDHLSIDYSDFDFLIDAGYQAAMKMMPEIKKLLPSNVVESQKSRKISINHDQLTEATISTIKVEGNKTTRTMAIRKDFPLKAGDHFRMNKAIQGMEKIYAWGLFKSVWLKLENLGHHNVAVTIEVEEKYPYIFKLGANYLTDFNASGFVQMSNRNIFGWGERVLIFYRIGKIKQQLGLEMLFDKIFGTNFTSATRIHYIREKPIFYQEDESIGSLSVTRYNAEISAGMQVKNIGLMRLGLKAEKSSLKENIFPAKEQTFWGPKVELLVDNRDDPIFPTKGGIRSLSYFSVTNTDVEKIQYSKLLGQINIYRTFGERHTFSLFGYGGLITGHVPIYDSFRLGGPIYLPGYHRDEIWGEKLLATGLKYRYKIYNNIYVLIRLSAANVWHYIEDMRLKDVKYGSSVSCALDSPIGPISIEYGRSNQGRNKFYFSAGYLF